MHSQVFVQIGLLSKALGAAWFVAFKWSFSCVHAQMIEEVVPLPEEHLATLVIALQDFDVALCPRVFILEYSKLPCFWNIFIDFDCGEVKVVTHLNEYFGTFWYFVSDLFVSNVVLADFLLEVRRIHKAEFPLLSRLTLMLLLFSFGNFFCSLPFLRRHQMLVVL